MSSSNYYRFSGMQFSKLTRFLDENNLIDTLAEKWSIIDGNEDFNISSLKESKTSAYENHKKNYNSSYNKGYDNYNNNSDDDLFNPQGDPFDNDNRRYSF